MENMMVVFVNALVDQIVNDGIDRDCITVQEVTKNNGKKHVALVIKKTKGSSIAPAVYADGYFSEWQEGRRSTEDIAQEFIRKSREAIDDGFVMPELNRDVILGHAFLQIAGARANANMILDRGIPYENLFDMVLIVRVRMTLDGSDGSFIVTNDMLRGYDITHEQLFKAAKDNVRNRFIFAPVEQIMAAIAGQIDDDQIDENAESDLGDHGLYVATNKDKSYGASVLAFPELLQKYAERLGGSVYIMPSSIHEVMVIKKTPDMDPDDLRGMVKEINHSQVLPEEVLTDNLYEFDLDTKELRVA